MATCKFFCDTGNKKPTRIFTAGSAIKAGDLVALAADDSKVDSVLANGAQALGWAVNGAAIGGAVTVIIGYPFVQAEMPITGTYAAGELGKSFVLAGESGAQTVNLDDSTPASLVLKLQGYDAATGLARVCVTSAAFQFGAKDVS